MTLLQFAVKQATTPESIPYVEQMRRSIIAAKVAQVLHYAGTELFHRNEVLWEKLPASEKKILIQLADDVLNDLAPPKCFICGSDCAEDSDQYCERCRPQAG